MIGFPAFTRFFEITRFTADMGKLRPAGQVRPAGPFILARQLENYTCFTAEFGIKRFGKHDFLSVCNTF